MKTRVLIIGIIMLVFGLINLFWYLPISFGITLMNTPFPFDHLYDVVQTEGKGISTQIGYMPIDEVINDPYWLVWSLALYGGIAMIIFAVWRQRT